MGGAYGIHRCSSCSMMIVDGLSVCSHCKSNQIIDEYQKTNDNIQTYTELAGNMEVISNNLSCFFEIVGIRKYGTDDEGVHELALVVRDKNGGEIVGKKIKCKPDLVPPGKGAHVWVMHHGKIWTSMSAGEFNEEGSLLIANSIDVVSGEYAIGTHNARNWCVVGDESHHSEGWNHKWLDKVR